VTVTVTADGSGRAGVTVELYDEGGSTELDSQTTGSNGQVTFSDLEPGSYDVEITLPADLELDTGQAARRTVQASEGATAQVTFALVTGQDVVEVKMTSGLRFEPADLTIAPGTTVRWVNASSLFHTITPDGHSEWASASVNNQGDTFLHTFNSAGDFPYYCQPHRSAGMTGTITVQ
jgi:plastocyanin